MGEGGEFRIIWLGLTISNQFQIVKEHMAAEAIGLAAEAIHLAAEWVVRSHII